MGAGDKIGRAFLEIGASIQPLVKDLDGAVKAMGEADAKLTSYGKRIGASFENALNPTLRLEKQVTALGAAGRSSADIVKVYGERILQASAIAERHGQTLTPVMKNYVELARATQASATSAAVMGTQLGRTAEELREARWASMLLTRQFGVQLPEAMQGFIAKSQLVGPILGQMFNVTAYAALGMAIFQAGKRTWEWATATEKVSEETKRINDHLDDSIKKLTEVRRQRELIGLTGTARMGMESMQLGQDIEAIRLQLGNLQSIRQSLATEAAQTRAVIGRGPEFAGEVMGYEPTGEALRAREALAKVDQQILQLQINLKIVEAERANIAKNILDTKREEAKEAAEELRKKIEAETKERIKALKETGERVGQILDDKRITWMGLPSGGAEDQEKIAADLEKSVMDTFRREEERRLMIEQRVRDAASEAREIINRQYQDTFNHWKNMAGHVFDSMLSSGKSAFESLAEFARGIFLTKLRDVFQNMVAELFTKLEAKGGLLGKLFAPSGGGMLSGLSISSRSSIGSSLATAAGTLIPTGTLGAGGTMALSGWASPEAAAQAGIAAGSGKAGAMSLGGQLFATGGMTVGTALVSDAFRRGSKLEGAVGGGFAGASMGMMLGTQIGALAGPVGMAVGAGVGALAGLMAGFFGGGEKRREEERKRRTDVQSQYYMEAPEAISRVGAFGIGGEANVEADLMGRTRAMEPTTLFGAGSVIINLVDGRQAEEAANRFVEVVSRKILLGGTQLADNVAWAAQ